LSDNRSLCPTIVTEKSVVVKERELRELGLVLADEFYDPVEVHLEKVLERALETPLWG
jgi:hypothetical protein